jgi:hypothetical protein
MQNAEERRFLYTLEQGLIEIESVIEAQPGFDLDERRECAVILRYK